MQEKKKAIICDIDGTLSDPKNRTHYVEKEPKDWNGFFSEMEEDACFPWCKGVILAMKEMGYEIILLTGRPERYRPNTLRWLEKHSVPYDMLIMRPDSLSSKQVPDYKMKIDYYYGLIEPEYNVLFILEDRNNVVKAWREEGLICLHCQDGDF